MTYDDGPEDGGRNGAQAADGRGRASRGSEDGTDGAPTFGALAQRILRLPARLGTVRLVVVDGPSGSGKTSIAKRLAWAMHRVPVVHMDHLYEGWSGLEAVGCALDAWVLTPLRNSLPGRHLAYDWRRGAYAEWREVPLAPALVVEGVGAGQRRVDPWTTLRIWVDCDAELRRERALHREGSDQQSNLEKWWADEEAHFVAEHTRQRADLIIDGTTEVGTDLSSPLTILTDRTTTPPTSPH